MKYLILCLTVLIVIAAPCAAQDPRGPFADVPTGHWAYQDADTLQKAGIEMLNPDRVSQGSHRPITRQEFAVKVARLLALLSGPQSSARSDTETRLMASPSAVAALQDLVSNFQPELSQLHVDVNSIQARLAEMAQTAAHPLATRPFADVPLTHWAASAIETLRVNRILAGYPQGTFTVSE